MAQEVQLRSARDGSTLSFGVFATTVEGISFVCRFASTNFSGAVTASTYFVEPPSRFFAAIAADWKIPREWRDTEDSVVLRSTGDAVGHVTLSVALRDHATTQTVSGEVELELGQLDDIAAKMRAVFGYDTLEQHRAWIRK